MRPIVALLVVALTTAAPSWAQSVPKGPSKYVGLTYDESRATEFHKHVLTAMGLTYTIEQLGQSTTVWWAPRSDVEAEEVQRRVSQYLFAIANCPASQWPTPETVSSTIKVCSKP